MELTYHLFVSVFVFQRFACFKWDVINSIVVNGTFGAEGLKSFKSYTQEKESNTWFCQNKMK